MWSNVKTYGGAFSKQENTEEQPNVFLVTSKCYYLTEIR